MNKKDSKTAEYSAVEKPSEEKTGNVKYTVESLKSKDKLIKQNIILLVSLLYGKNETTKFREAIGIDSQTLSEFKALDRNIMPTENIKAKIENYFIIEFKLDKDNTKLDDKDLKMKLIQQGWRLDTRENEISRIKKNIEAIRVRHKESQQQLADAIGVERNAISQYENLNNNRLPEKKILFDIARHYGIPIDELLYGDCDYEPLPDVPVNSKAVAAIIIDGLLPYFEYSAEDTDNEKNINFKKALSIHNRLYKYVINNSVYDHIDDVKKLMYFYKAAAEEGSMKAVANHLWWIIYFGIGIFNITDDILENKDKISDFRTKVSDFLKLGGFKRPAKIRNSSNNVVENIQQNFIDEYEIMILQDILWLKKGGWGELADYYTALRYRYGIIRNEITPEFYRSVGIEMMKAFYSMGNPYVKRYYKMRYSIPPTSKNDRKSSM